MRLDDAVTRGLPDGAAIAEKKGPGRCASANEPGLTALGRVYNDSAFSVASHRALAIVVGLGAAFVRFELADGFVVVSDDAL
jgi:hypothetical protein